MAQQEIRTEDGSALRSSGLDTLGSIPWGTHMCLFYETKADLLATLVPYFTAGLEANECCFWVTSDLLTVEEAAAALRDAIPNLEQCIRNCQMTITEHTAFFLREGRFDRHEVLRKWQIALNDALNKGFVGVRATGDTSWLQKEEWSEFMQCEVDFERMFGNAPVILLCTYNTRKFDASEGQDVVGRHEFALTRTYARRHAARNVSLGNNVQDAPLRATAMGEGLALHEIVANETGMPCDYIFLDVDAGFERMISLRRNAVLGKRISEVFPGLDRKWIESCCRVAQTGRAARFEGHIKQVGRWYDIIAYRTAPGQFATRLRDITERKQAEATLQWRARRNELLADAAALLLKSTHPQSIIEELCCKVMQVLDCQFFFNYLLDKDKKQLHLNACGGVPEEDYVGLEWLDYGTAICGCAARDAVRIVASNVSEDTDPRSEIIRTYGIQAYCASPLMAHGKVIGTLSFGTRTRVQFTQCEIETMETVAGLVAIAISRVQTEEALRQSEARLRAIMDAVPIGIAMIDGNGDRFISNAAFNRIWGTEQPPPKTRFDHRAYPAWRIDTGERLATEDWAASSAIDSGKTVIAQLLRIRTLDGRRVYISNNAAPIRDTEGKVLGAAVGIVDITEQIETLKALRQSQQDLKHAQAVGSTGSWRYDVREDIVTWSDETYRIFGVSRDAPISHRVFLDHVHIDDRAEVERSWKRVLGGAAEDIEYRIIVGGKEKWVRARAVLEFDASGQVTAVFGVNQDITDRKRREEQIQLLLREVNHRAKNMLTLVQAIAWQTTASEPKEFVERFSERIRALAASQDLLVQSGWRGVGMEALVRSQLAHFVDLIGTRIVIEGPDLRLTASASQTIGMALHELATNAGKYGALSDERGTVTIAWKTAREEKGMDFVLTWAESGGPLVNPPTRRGFGHTVIDIAPRVGLGASIRLDYAIKGIRWSLVCAAENVLD